MKHVSVILAAILKDVGHLVSHCRPCWFQKEAEKMELDEQKLTECEQQIRQLSEL